MCKDVDLRVVQYVRLRMRMKMCACGHKEDRVYKLIVVVALDSFIIRKAVKLDTSLAVQAYMEPINM